MECLAKHVMSHSKIFIIVGSFLLTLEDIKSTTCLYNAFFMHSSLICDSVLNVQTFNVYVEQAKKYIKYKLEGKRIGIIIAGILILRIEFNK